MSKEEKETKEEKPKEEKKKEHKKEAAAKEEAPAAAAAAPEEAEKKVERKMEAFYPERLLKDGTAFLKRKKGKPRYRKIVSKKRQAQLFQFQGGEWKQRAAIPTYGPTEGLRWHLRNKWIKIEEKDIPKPEKRKPKAAPAAEAPASPEATT